MFEWILVYAFFLTTLFMLAVALIYGVLVLLKKLFDEIVFQIVRYRYRRQEM